MVDVVVDDGIVGPVEVVYSDVVSGNVDVVDVVELVGTAVDGDSDVAFVVIGMVLGDLTVVCGVVTTWHVLLSESSTYPEMHTQFDKPGPEQIQIWLQLPLLTWQLFMGEHEPPSSFSLYPELHVQWDSPGPSFVHK